MGNEAEEKFDFDHKLPILKLCLLWLNYSLMNWNLKLLDTKIHKKCMIQNVIKWKTIDCKL